MGHHADNRIGGTKDGKFFSMWTDGITATAKNADSAADDAEPAKSSKPAESKTEGPTVVTNFVGGTLIAPSQ